MDDDAEEPSRAEVRNQQLAPAAKSEPALLRLAWTPVAPRYGSSGTRWDRGGYECVSTWTARGAHGCYRVERIAGGRWRVMRRVTAVGGLRRWAGRVIGRVASAAEAIRLAERDDVSIHVP
jgi:hypothetical protein